MHWCFLSPEPEQIWQPIFLSIFHSLRLRRPLGWRKEGGRRRTRKLAGQDAFVTTRSRRIRSLSGFCDEDHNWFGAVERGFVSNTQTKVQESLHSNTVQGWVEEKLLSTGLQPAGRLQYQPAEHIINVHQTLFHHHIPHPVHIEGWEDPLPFQHLASS